MVDSVNGNGSADVAVLAENGSGRIAVEVRDGATGAQLKRIVYMSAKWTPHQLRALAREFMLDGTIEAVNRTTVSAQTSGDVEEIFFDVDDYVEQGQLQSRDLHHPHHPHHPDHQRHHRQQGETAGNRQPDEQTQQRDVGHAAPPDKNTNQPSISSSPIIMLKA